MTTRNSLLRAGQVAAIFALGFSLIGCEGIRQATGAAKLPPDEFTVLTKAPLVIPPDYNLRPPQPGVASRNDTDADDQGRAALFPQNGAAAAASLGTAYSDGEKLLLTKTNALAVDPNIRKSIITDVGQEDQGPGFAQRVLFSGPSMAPAAPAAATPAPAAAPAAASPAAPAPMPLLEGTGAPLPARTPAPAPAPAKP
jgi:hypothetical protein